MNTIFVSSLTNKDKKNGHQTEHWKEREREELREVMMTMIIMMIIIMCTKIRRIDEGQKATVQ